MASVGKCIRLALLQLKVGANKPQNLQRAKKLVKEAVSNKANVVCLPECFNSPYGVQYFSEYAEKIPGDSSNFLSSLAKDLSIYLIGGSIPEEDNGKLYNTCLVYDPEGNEIAKHRKVHLFDVDVPGGIKFTESDVLSPGNKTTIFNIGPWKVGLGICYDIRFPGFSKVYEKEGCHLLIYPGAFSITTGPKHWELLVRARSCDNQAYIAGCSPARDENASYIAWGHSTVCNPWAEIIAKAGSDEEIIYSDLDLAVVDTVRTAIPIQSQQRSDVY